MNDGCIKSDAFMHSMDDSRERERDVCDDGCFVMIFALCVCVEVRAAIFHKYN